MVTKIHTILVRMFVVSGNAHEIGGEEYRNVFFSAVTSYYVKVVQLVVFLSNCRCRSGSSQIQTL